MITDIGFSVIRNWMIGVGPSAAPSGMIMGTNSGNPAFSDTKITGGSPVNNTLEQFQYRSGIGINVAEFEYYVQSGDVIAGSPTGIVREIGMYNGSAQQLFFRDNIFNITLDGSVEIQSLLRVNII